MSTSPLSLSSVSSTAQPQNLMQEIMQDFKQLASSLQSGDLSGAQKAYSALQQLLPNQSQSSQASTSASNPISTDFAALGKALQSGNLSSAQEAFSQLQNDLQSASSSSTANSLTQAMRGHHHHHRASNSESSSSSSSSGGSSGETGQTVNVLA